MDSTIDQSATDTVRCLLLPLAGGQALVPSTAVAEVAEWQRPSGAGENAGAWLGVRDWRGLLLPVLSLEALAGSTPASPGQRARCAVFNTLGKNPQRPFYGILIQDVPQIVTVTEACLQEVPGDTPHPAMRRVRWMDGDSVVWVPDPDTLEQLLTMALGAASHAPA